MGCNACRQRLSLFLYEESGAQFQCLLEDVHGVKRHLCHQHTSGQSQREVDVNVRSRLQRVTEAVAAAYVRRPSPRRSGPGSVPPWTLCLVHRINKSDVDPSRSEVGQMCGRRIQVQLDCPKSTSDDLYRPNIHIFPQSAGVSRLNFKFLSF